MPKLNVHLHSTLPASPCVAELVGVVVLAEVAEAVPAVTESEDDKVLCVADVAGDVAAIVPDKVDAALALLLDIDATGGLRSVVT